MHLLRSVGRALQVAGVILSLIGLGLVTLFFWPDAWLEWLAQYWRVLRQERGGLSIFMYTVVSFASGIASAIVGTLLLGVLPTED